jgi:uncharacterized protein with HEPN domain
VPSSRPRQRFQDIVDNAEKIARYTAGMSEVDFRNQELIVDAVERCLMRISEAAVKLGADAERLCADQPWADIRGLGNSYATSTTRWMRTSSGTWSLAENSIS